MNVVLNSAIVTIVYVCEKESMNKIGALHEWKAWWTSLRVDNQSVQFYSFKFTYRSCVSFRYQFLAIDYDRQFSSIFFTALFIYSYFICHFWSVLNVRTLQLCIQNIMSFTSTWSKLFFIYTFKVLMHAVALLLPLAWL